MQRIIAGSAEEAQAATASVLEALQQGSLNVLGLVRSMPALVVPLQLFAMTSMQQQPAASALPHGQVGLLQRPLTDDVDHEGRAKAVQLLAQVGAEADLHCVAQSTPHCCLCNVVTADGHVFHV